MVANWYARNLRIIGKVLRVVSPGDRVLLLFGHDHAAVLAHLLSRIPGVTAVDPLPYLPASH